MNITPYTKGLLIGGLVSGSVLTGGLIIVDLTQGMPAHGHLSYALGVGAMVLLEKSVDVMNALVEDGCSTN